MPTYRVKTEKMVNDGTCLARHEGKTMFIPAALPGEVLDVAPVKEYRDYSIATILSIIQPSPHRVQPFCPLYGRCGGCTLQHCDEDYQRTLRTDILRDAFAREGISVPDIRLVCGRTRNYRARFQFHDGGMMERQSAVSIPLSACLCATDEVNAWLRDVPPERRPAGRCHVFGSGKIIDGPHIVIAPEKARSEPAAGKKRGRKEPRPLFSGTRADSDTSCGLKLAGKELRFDVRGFFQSNLDVLETAIPLICDVRGTSVLDMYAGAGTFSLFLAERFERLCLVEHNRDALVYAEQNLRGTEHESYGVSGETWVRYHAESYRQRNGPLDAVVIDPPRSGMEKAVCTWLCGSDIPAIQSLSCDCATHARDARQLLDAGYRLEALYLLDFYPQTCHIESLALFRKA